MIKSELNFDIKQLRSFIEVLRQKSFTKASRKLKIGQATISHHINQLEKTLGVTLINRTSRDISITAQGKIFQQFCELFFSNIESLKRDLANDEPAGITKIASSTIPVAYILPKILAAMQREYPDIICRLNVADSKEAIEMVKEGRADIGIVGNEYKHPSLKYTPFFRDEIVLVGNRNHPDRIVPGDLLKMPLIIRESGSGSRKAYEEALSKYGITPSKLMTVMECSSNEGIKESVSAGLGVSFMSRLAVEREIHQRILKIIFIKGVDIKRFFYHVHSISRRRSPSVTLLLDYLMEFGKKSGIEAG